LITKRILDIKLFSKSNYAGYVMITKVMRIPLGTAFHPERPGRGIIPQKWPDLLSFSA
jgi:hypothetical protein